MRRRFPARRARPPRSTGGTCPTPPAKFGGDDQPQRLPVQAVLAAAGRAAQGCAERAAHHDRRRRLRCTQHLRRRHPDAGTGPHRQDGAALHQLPLHRPLLADAGGADHRPQPPLGRLRRRSRKCHRLPGLQQHHRARTRPRSARSCATTATARPGSARTTTRPNSSPARPGRSTSGPSAWASSTSTASSAATRASGSRTCSATPPRSTPTSASPGWNLTTAMADEAVDWMHQLNEIAPDKPFFCYYVPGGTHAPHHPTPGVDQEDPATCTCSTAAGTSCARRSSPTRRSSA